MKNISNLFLICFFFLSCEEVINVDLDTAEPRLVIDASLHWDKGTTGNNQTIKLSLTAPYFDDVIPPATGANVTVTDSNNNIFLFTEEDNSGIYNTQNFIPDLGETYTLNIIYNNETYVATETMIPVAPIDYIEQNSDGGFAGDEIEIKAYYSDPALVENFYLFEFDISKFETTYLGVYSDEFSDGNSIFAYYSNEDLKTGDELIIKNSGISKRTYEFFNILLQQTDENSGDPFQTQTATVRGNCINKTNPNNFALGYFRVSETDVFSYIIE